MILSFFQLYFWICLLNRTGEAVECSSPPAWGICLHLQSCTDQVLYDNTVVEAQVTSGARLVRALSRNRAFQLVVGTQRSFGVMVLL